MVFKLKMEKMSVPRDICHNTPVDLVSSDLGSKNANGNKCLSNFVKAFNPQTATEKRPLFATLNLTVFVANRQN